MPTLPSGMDWIAGAVAAAVLLPLLAIGAGMPFWLAGLISMLAGAGTVAIFTPKKLFAQLDASGAARGKIEFARELLTDAEPLVGRMEAAVKSIRSREVAERVRHLVGTARDIFTAIEKDPLRVDRVRRFLTYYLPRAAEIAEAYGSLERSLVPNQTRIAATRELIDRLDLAFTRYAASLQDADLDTLDIEIKLLKSSLDEDLGPVAGSAAARDQVKGST